MIYKHNLLVGLFGTLDAVHRFYFGCRNALGLIATYSGYHPTILSGLFIHNLKRAQVGFGRLVAEARSPTIK